MNFVAVSEFFRKNLLIVLIVIVAAAAILFRSGAEKLFFLALLVACACFNALFLRAPFEAIRSPSVKTLIILFGMLATNVALFVLLKFDPLITFLVWLPAIAGVITARLGSIKGRAK